MIIIYWEIDVQHIPNFQDSFESPYSSKSWNNMVHTTAQVAIFSTDVWNLITETGPLHFSLSGTFMNGENFKYIIVVDVKDIF